MCIFSTMIAKQVCFKTKVSITEMTKVIRKGQIYLNSVLWLTMQTPLSFFDQKCSYLEQQ